MNKINRHHSIQIIAWASCFVILLAVILIPKHEALYKIFGYLFFVVFFLAPPVLFVFHLAPYVQKKPVQNDQFIVIPIVGFLLFEMLAFIYFVESLNQQGKQIMTWALLSIILYNIGAIFFLGHPKAYCHKRHLILSIGALALFVMFLAIGIYTSYEYSIMW